VIAAYGRGAVWVEMSDGKLRLLPLAWTSLHPRPDPLAVGEKYTVSVRPLPAEAAA